MSKMNTASGNVLLDTLPSLAHQGAPGSFPENSREALSLHSSAVSNGCYLKSVDCRFPTGLRHMGMKYVCTLGGEWA